MPFKVYLSKQGKSFNVSKDESVLDAALRQHHSLPYACRNGTCGTCMATLLEGEIGYGFGIPEGLSGTEHQQGILLCKAKAMTDLKIETRTSEVITETGVRQLPCRVARCERLNESIIRLVLELPKTESLNFIAGQYIDILMKDGKRRSFSLANPPHENQHVELHIRHYQGGLFSEYAFNDLKDKALLRIEGPFGQFSLNQSERPIIMIAGGTGFAPINSLIAHALNLGERRPIHLYCGVPTKADLYFDETAKRWAIKYKHINYIPVLSETQNSPDWNGRTGLVHLAVLEDFNDLSAYDVYVCGPPVMVNAVVETFPDNGLNRDRLYSDSFEFSTS